MYPFQNYSVSKMCSQNVFQHTGGTEEDITQSKHV